MLFKPSTDSSCGAGIRVIKDSERDKFIEDVRNNQIALKTHTDFVVQLFVKQSSDTAIFNPSSLNCMRITTLNLNGLVTTNSMTYKCGANNAIVDNLGSGKTGVMVGVSPDGTLASHGFYGNGDMCTEHNGITFANHRIKAFDQVVSAAIKLHSEIAVCHIIGWDIALDENNNPILIEGNTLYPGISIEQMCSGPIFGDRVDEIIDYISYSKKHY